MRHLLCIGLLALAGAWAADMPVVQPKELAGRLAAQRGSIVIFQVGPNLLYRLNHIPGAIYAGPANRPEGLELLKAEAAKLPRDREIVLYCGCCPWNHCPTIRPAMELMRQMGFPHARALYLPDNFKTDWIDQGYPVEEGAARR
ncbi:MAG: rhodanese-like domain-containing protein [Bryobacteraceae bacterium]